jgi:hypothetical protein
LKLLLLVKSWSINPKGASSFQVFPLHKSMVYVENLWEMTFFSIKKMDNLYNNNKCLKNNIIFCYGISNYRKSKKMRIKEDNILSIASCINLWIYDNYIAFFFFFCIFGSCSLHMFPTLSKPDDFKDQLLGRTWNTKTKKTFEKAFFNF